MNFRWTSGGIGSTGLLLTFAALLISTAPARADSELMLPYPSQYGKIPAATFDSHRQRVGDANLEVEKLEDGTVRLFAESGVDGGARTIATATLTPIAGTNLLRPVYQESSSFDANHFVQCSVG